MKNIAAKINKNFFSGKIYLWIVFLEVLLVHYFWGHNHSHETMKTFVAIGGC